MKDNLILKSLKISITGQIQKVDVLTDVITKPERLKELANLKAQLKSQLKQLTEI